MSSKSRIQSDVMKLLMSDYTVHLVRDNLQEFNVIFQGPQGTSYEGGTWKIHVELPNEYPYKSPSIGFLNRIFHPNIDETSGSVCLDVINQTWSPMFDMFNIFDVFLPQLLSYPNAADPLNSDASQLYMNDIDSYHARVKEYVEKYAGEVDLKIDDEVSEEEDGQLSSGEESIEEDEEEESDYEEDEEEEEEEEEEDDDDNDDNY